MDALTVPQALQASTFTQGFTAEQIERLAASARWQHFVAGAVLFREGQCSDTFYIVHHGHVTLEMCLPARGCMALLTLGPGDVIAWSALIGDGRMSATAIANDDVALLEFSGAEMRRQCDADPVFGYRMMFRMSEALSRRLLATRLQLLDLFQADAFPAGTESR